MRLRAATASIWRRNSNTMEEESSAGAKTGTEAATVLACVPPWSWTDAQVSKTLRSMRLAAPFLSLQPARHVVRQTTSKLEADRRELRSQGQAKAMVGRQIIYTGTC